MEKSNYKQVKKAIWAILRNLPDKVLVKELQRRGFQVWKPIQEDTAQEFIRRSEALRQIIKTTSSYLTMEMEKREHEIEQEATAVTGRFSFRNGYSTAKDAFIEGAKWADANPVNPWHKASDEPPKEKGMYIVQISGYNHPVTMLWGKYGWDNPTDAVITHWMEIPKNEEE